MSLHHNEQHHDYVDEPLDPHYEVRLWLSLAVLLLTIFLLAGLWYELGFTTAFILFCAACLITAVVAVILHINERRWWRAFLTAALHRGHSIEVKRPGQEVRTISPWTIPAGPLTIKDVTIGGQESAAALERAASRLDEFYEAIPRNSLQTGLGSKVSTGELVTASIPEAVHFKLIGASGFGKSCLAGAMLDIATTTNSPDVLRIALLDLEWKTASLFEHLPHVYEVRSGGRIIRMVGRDADEVAARLGSLKQELNRRATGNLDRPLLLIYVEEMLSLQYEVDPDLQKQMLADLNILALRGRKYGIFFLACMQVDYSSKELREAKGMFRTRGGFAIDPPAARASGFVNTELVKTNFQRGRIGQYVLEKPAFSELVLAPRYDVATKVTTKATTNPTTTTPFFDDVVVATTPPVEPLVVDSRKPLSLRSLKVLELLRQKQGQNEIIKEVWGITYKDGRAYSTAVEEYREIIAALVAQANE
jgi:FtsK/SpoIIIE family